MTDLLPPSPSHVYHPSHSFTSSPSALSYFSSGQSETVALSKEAATVSSTSTATTAPTFSLPQWLPGETPPISLDLPVLKQLHFGELISDPSNAHAQLTKTIDDLARMLSIVEIGLSGMLDPLSAATIKEEQEDIITFLGK